MVTIRTLPTDYTSEEKLKLAETLSSLNIRIETLMNEKTNLPKKIASLQAEAAELAKDFKSGKSNKQVECYWKFDTPFPGKKTLCRVDNNEELNEIENMNLFDIEEGETVFKLLRKNFLKGEPTAEYLELTGDEGTAVLNTILPETQTNIVIDILSSQYKMKRGGKILIEQGDFVSARKIIKDTLQSFSDEQTAEISKVTESPGESKEEVAEVELQEEKNH